MTAAILVKELQTLNFSQNEILQATCLIGLIAAIRTTRRWPWLYALLCWPGTFMHELMHLLAGIIVGAKPVSFSTWPARQANGSMRLGYVGFAGLTLWQTVPVALAPFALLPAAAGFFRLALEYPVLSTDSGLLLLATQQSLFSAWPSRQDYMVAFTGLLILSVIAALLAWAIYGS